MVDPKRPDVTAIHSIDRFVLSVPDLAVAEKYFSTFGLDVRNHGQRLDLYTFGHDHCWGSVHESGKPKKLEYLSLGVYQEDFAPLKSHVSSQNVAFAQPHPFGKDEGFWISDPDGNALQIKVAEKSSPNEKAPALGSRYKKNPIDVPIGPNRSEGGRVQPLRLSHILLFASDVGKSLKFYSDVLGFRLSDKSADVIAFTHGAHSSDHHLLALAKSDGPGLHHTSWVVQEIDDVGLGMEQMLAAGYAKGWGVGRHVIGSNYFYYAQDPWGSFTEYSYDIDFIGVDTVWPSGDYQPEDSLYLWGPPLPEDFITNYETRSASLSAA